MDIAIVLIDWATWLQTCGVGTRGTVVFDGRLPDLPGLRVAVLNYASARPDFTMPNTDDAAGYLPSIQRPAVQVFVKGGNGPTGFADASAKMRQAFEASVQLVNRTVGSTRFVNVNPVQSPTFVGDNESGEPMFSVNFECEVG